MQKATDFSLIEEKGGEEYFHCPPRNVRPPLSQTPSRTQSEQPRLWAAAARQRRRRRRRLSDSNSCLAEARRGEDSLPHDAFRCRVL